MNGKEMAAVELMKLILTSDPEAQSANHRVTRTKLWHFQLYQQCHDIVNGGDPDAVAARDAKTAGRA